MFGGDTLFELRSSLHMAEIEREGVRVHYNLLLKNNFSYPFENVFNSFSPLTSLF